MSMIGLEANYSTREYRLEAPNYGDVDSHTSNAFFLTQVYKSMSLRRNTSEMIAEKLPPKVSTNGAGLRKRPQFEQIANYLNF